MSIPLILFLLSAGACLVTGLLILVQAFRTSLWWGLIALFVPFGRIVFILKHWHETATLFIVQMLSFAAVVGLLVGTSLGEDFKNARNGRVAEASAPAPTSTPHEVRDLAENNAPTPIAQPTPDPRAAQRAAYAKHAQELNTLYQQLDAERGKLKPGSPAIAAFNAKAAKYQGAVAALADEKSRLDAADGTAPARPVSAQATGDQAAGAARTECDRTTHQIQAIVNQTPPTVPKPPPHAEVYHYAFHPGANPPDYRAENLLATREPWKGQFVYMEDAPGVYYRSADCEFNPQTKCFYTSRDVPKKRLSDAEYQELTRLYRLLGQQQKALADAVPLTAR